MKQLIISLVAGAVAVLVPGLAYAQLGDTLAETCAHYGQPVHHDGNSYSFRIGKWGIIEWLNPNTGHIEAIEYSLQVSDTKIGEDKYVELVSANVPKSYSDSALWNRNDYRWDTILNNWFCCSESKDGIYYIEFGKSYSENRKHFDAYLLITLKSCKDQAATEWHTEH